MNFHCFYSNFTYNMDILLIYNGLGMDIFPIPKSFPTALTFNYLVFELSELHLNT